MTPRLVLIATVLLCGCNRGAALKEQHQDVGIDALILTTRGIDDRVATLERDHEINGKRYAILDERVTKLDVLAIERLKIQGDQFVGLLNRNATLQGQVDILEHDLGRARKDLEEAMGAITAARTEIHLLSSTLDEANDRWERTIESVKDDQARLKLRLNQ